MTKEEIIQGLYRGDSRAIKEAIKALEQQPSDDCVSRAEVDRLCFEYLKPNTDDNIAFYEHFCDLQSVTPAIPTCDDCVSRQALINSYNGIETPVGYRKVVDMQVIEDLPPVTPTHGTCKNCSHRDPEDKKCDCGHTIEWQTARPDNWYCADFEKRGNEND